MADAVTTTDSPDREHFRSDLVTISMIAAGVLVAWAILGIVRAAPDALTALGVGVLFALALDPVLRAVQRRLHCSRAVGTIVVGTALTLVLGGVVLILGPRAASQASRFADELPDTIRELYGWPLIGSRLERADAVGGVERFVDDLPSSIDADSLAEIADRLLTSAGLALLVLVTATAILFDGEAIVARTRRMIPPARRSRADEIGRIIYRSLARYFAGSVAVALLNGFMILSVGLALGIPLAPLAALWATLTNLIPQIGGFLGGSFFVLLAVTQGPVTGGIALVVFLAYQQFENNVIQPTVIGRAVDLTPPTTMLAALIGGAAAGVPGALVATPLVGAAKSVWMDSRTGGRAGDVDGADEGQGRSTALRRLVERVLGDG